MMEKTQPFTASENEPAPDSIYDLDELEHETQRVTDQLEGLIQRYDPAGGMVGNKEMVRAWRRMYSLWNQAELMDEAMNRNRLTPLEGWRQYVDLWEFCMKTVSDPDDFDFDLNIAERETYYENVLRMEAWRQAREQAA